MTKALDRTTAHDDHPIDTAPGCSRGPAPCGPTQEESP
jgi:hypothetical protein